MEAADYFNVPKNTHLDVARYLISDNLNDRVGTDVSERNHQTIKDNGFQQRLKRRRPTGEFGSGNSSSFTDVLLEDTNVLSEGNESFVSSISSCSSLHNVSELSCDFGNAINSLQRKLIGTVPVDGGPITPFDNNSTDVRNPYAGYDLRYNYNKSKAISYLVDLKKRAYFQKRILSKLESLC